MTTIVASIGSAAVASRAVHVLVDLENNQPTLDQVMALVPDMTDVWLFHSGKQAKHLECFKSLGQRQMHVPIARPGKNSLDFHLSFYLGYIAAKNPGAKLVVIAIDDGYAPMIEHAVQWLDLDVIRLSTRAPTAPRKMAKKKAKPAAKKSAKKASAVGKASKPAAKKTVPKKPAVAPGLSKKSAKAATSIPSDDIKMLHRLAKGLRKMGDKAPGSAKTYRQHLKAMLGKDATSESVEAAVAALARHGLATIDNKAVKYDFTAAI